MGIKFTCPACGRPLNVKSELAGKRGRCPKCQAKIAIPLEDAPGGGAAVEGPQTEAEGTIAVELPSPPVGLGPVAATSAPAPAAGGFLAEEPSATTSMAKPAGSIADPITEAPNLQWYAAPPGGTTQWGPASGDEFRAWMREGRVTADALVWRQDWADWKRAGAIFPQLETVAGRNPLAAPVVSPLAAMPLPTAMAGSPLMAARPPAAQPAFPMPGMATGGFPPAPLAAPPAGPADFPITTPESTKTRSVASRGRPYRQRSNTGPIVAIVVLLLAMIPLSFFVWKVVSEQLGEAPPAETATGPKQPEE